MKLLEITVSQCSGDYFDCDETDLVTSDYNDTMATGNGMVKLLKDIPEDMNVSNITFKEIIITPCYDNPFIR